MMIMVRLTRTMMVLEWALVMIVFVAYAETIASYSGRYTADLEQKQMLLEQIKEETVATESDMKNGHDKSIVGEKKTVGNLRMENIDLAKIMYPTKQINAVSVGMSGTLSAKSCQERFEHDRED